MRRRGGYVLSKKSAVWGENPHTALLFAVVKADQIIR